MAISNDDLKTLVNLLTPVVKAELESGSTGMGSLEVVPDLDGVSSLPALRKRGAEITVVEAPVSLLKGEKGDQGDRGDDLEYKLLDSFLTLDALKAAYPEGTAEQGFFIAGDGMYVWSPKEEAFREICLAVDKVFTSEVFSEVYPSGDRVTIDFSKTPYAKVTLGQDHLIYGLDIRNTREGSCGKVMVYQTGLRQLTMSERLRGTIDLPLNVDTIAILSYNRVGEYVYIHTSTVIGDKSFPVPQKVKDFQVTYSDNSSCTVQWTAPWANNIYDKGTIYDMRYANSLVEPDDPKVWAGLRKVDGTPAPATPGTLQRMTISGLVPNKEYYLYLRTVKVNFGVEYSSPASDFAYFRTSGSEDMSKSYRIPLTAKNLSEQYSNPVADSNGSPCTLDRIVDEAERNVFLDDGYPDIKNKDYTTYWLTFKYSRNSSPFDINIDLFSSYALDKIFVYSRGKPMFSVWTMFDVGYPWQKAGEMAIGFNSWGSLDLRSFQCRFLKISFDLMDFNFKLGEGQEGLPGNDEFNGTIDRIDNLLLYGRPTSTRPAGIMPPLRRSTTSRTVEQFFCTNGHAYQQGRIHSMCSGKLVRLYISPGHFASFQAGALVPCSRVADMRYNVDDISWVKANNGTGQALPAHLRDTYKRYGIKPYLTFTSVFDYCIYDKSPGADRHNRQLDCYWLPGVWKALPGRGVGGLDKYHAVTTDASSYKTVARLAYALGAKYGPDTTLDGQGLFWPLSADPATGLGILSGIEIENEPDQTWSGWRGYTSAAEFAAICSAAADGHGGTMEDEDGEHSFGANRAGLLAISSGTAGINIGYQLSAMLHWMSTRPRADIPVDALSIHQYFSSAGNQGSSTADTTLYAVTVEEAMENKSRSIKDMIALRDRFCPGKEIWLTEFGYGESGGRNTKSNYQCYTQPGRKLGDWLIPDRHRSDVKGAWTVRGTLWLMSHGVDMVNYYSTECEGNYFGTGQWDSGAGFEMFHWNDINDDTPGARAEYIKRFEHSQARGGFAVTGLFGNALSNGCYPISRAYWWIATMRNRLKGYVHSGRKYVVDGKVVIHCFRERGGDRGAYVIYYNDSRNTGVAGVEIPLPVGVTSYRHVTVHVPELPSPELVSTSLGWDRNRTGLPTSRKERFEGGKWVVLENTFELHTPSYTKAPASYPADPGEGDEITVLPTTDENPYFPIVGPVGARDGFHVKNNLTASEWEQDRELWQSEPNLDADGNVVWTQKGNSFYAWRQVDAVCDYIDYHPDGIRGANGDERVETAIRGMIRTDVSEFPEFYLFDTIPDPDYRSEVTDLSSRTISSSTIELWWNNTSVEDTAYEIFVSSLPEVGYAPLKTVAVEVENKAVISGLSPDTTYYYKIRPLKGGKTGTLSDYVPVRTYQDIQPPMNLRILSRTATSITLSWDYPGGQSADFIGYAIYRAEGEGTHVQTALVEDHTVHVFEDTGLSVGRAYRYKARALGLNGVSGYTDETETRTLLPEECPPVPRMAMTDKLGEKVTLTLDLPVGVVPSSAKVGILLTEDGSQRLVKAVSRDGANPNLLILSIPQGSLADHDRKTDIRISYDGKGGIMSAYGVALEAFSNVRVANQIGNFTNIEAVFQVNICDGASPPAEGWNNLVSEAGRENRVEGLVDTYGRKSGITMTKKSDDKAWRWGSILTNGHCEIEGVPETVYKPQLALGYGNTLSQGVRSRLVLSGLDGERRYTVKAYGGTTYGDDVSVLMRIGGISTPAIRIRGNKTGTLVIEDISPVNGGLDIDFVNPVEGLSPNPLIGFVIIEEYRSNTAPENTDVWLREATILEDDGGGVVRFPDVTVHLACIGKVTGYRVGEIPDMTGIPWSDLAGDTMDVPYSLSVGFGDKTLYVQVRNLYGESNVRTIPVEYRDPYTPLVLKNIYINDDDPVTYSRDVRILADKEGIPMRYWVSEMAAPSPEPWEAWPDPKVSVIPYRLSAGSGRKTVYTRIKDATTESPVRVDTIEYLSVADMLTSVSINGGTATTTDGNLSVALVTIGTPSMMQLSESPDFAGTPWVPFESPVTFPVSGMGLKTVYARVRIDEILVSQAKSAGVEIVDRPPLPGNRKLAISLSWEKNEYDAIWGVNKISTANSKVGTPIKWSDGSPGGTFTTINVPANGFGTDKEGAVTGSDVFDYPDEYMRHNSLVQVWNGVKVLEVKIALAAGRYGIRLFNSTVMSQSYALPFARYYVVTAGYGTGVETRVEVAQPSGYTFVNNISAWIETEFYNQGEFYLRIETVRTGGTVTAPVNIIEIIPG